MRTVLNSLNDEIQESLAIGFLVFIFVIVFETIGVTLGMVDLTNQLTLGLIVIATLGLPIGVPTLILLLKELSKSSGRTIGSL